MFQLSNPKLSPFLQFDHAMDAGSQLFVKQLLNPSQSKLPFTITNFDVLPGLSTPIDQHAVEETWYIIKGQGKLIFEGNEYSVAANDWLYFPSQKKHQLVNHTEEIIRVLSIYW